MPRKLRSSIWLLMPPSSYNMIIGQSDFNQLGSFLYTLYLCMKCLLSDELLRVIQGDLKFSRKCYVERLKLKMVRTLGVSSMKAGSGIKPLGEACKGNEVPPLASEEIKDL